MQKVNKELLENLRKNLKIIECLNELKKLLIKSFKNFIFMSEWYKSFGFRRESICFSTYFKNFKKRQ